MQYIHPLTARAVLLVKYTCLECLYHWFGGLLDNISCLDPQCPRQVARLWRGAPLRGGLVPQELFNLLIEQSCPV